MTTRGRGDRRRSRRGFTLVEILVVVALMSVVMVAVANVGKQLPSARLKSTATRIVAAIRTAYTRATATSKHLRLALDLDKHTITLEEADIPMLVQSKDIAQNGGAEAVTDAQRIAVADAERFQKSFTVARSRFHPVSMKSTKASGSEMPKPEDLALPLRNGIHFRQSQSSHDDNPLKKGTAYLYFWPGGLTERANIQIRVGDRTEDAAAMTLVVSPLTGHVTVKTGAVEYTKPLDDREASEREDTGF
jgi:general secretion pathway protein H